MRFGISCVPDLRAVDLRAEDYDHQGEDTADEG
jgi:hypothetical protein